MIYGIILAGGRGERFWPLSRAQRPKQLLRLISDKTMLQETIDRILPLIPIERILVVTSEDITQLILDEIKILKPESILAEPQGKNTCVAIGLAAEHLKKVDPEAIMVVLSADHIIRPAEKLIDIIKVGAELAAEGDHLITIGIDPTRAETAYGYIKLANQYKVIDSISIFEVDSFTEKPKSAVAQQYYYGRKHLWNSGMFIWSAEAVLKAITQCQPEIGGMLKSYAARIGTGDEIKERQELYKRCEPISIDFAVLENAENVLAIKGDIIWDDVGSWNALERYKDRDAEHNVVIGEAILHESYETTVYNDADGLVACLGTADLVVVRASNITLVAHRTKLGQIKELLARLGENEKTRHYL